MSDFKASDKKEPKKKLPLTPKERELYARGYEECALKIQELYQMKYRVTEAVTSCLAHANEIRAGKVE